MQNSNIQDEMDLIRAMAESDENGMGRAVIIQQIFPKANEEERKELLKIVGTFPDENAKNLAIKGITLSEEEKTVTKGVQLKTEKQDKVVKAQNGEKVIGKEVITQHSDLKIFLELLSLFPQKLLGIFFPEIMKSTRKINDHKRYKQAFNKIKYGVTAPNENKKTILQANKPICIFAVSKEKDDNGAIISKGALNSMKRHIKDLSQFYTVVPIMFGEKEKNGEKIDAVKDLSNKVEKWQSQKFGTKIDIGLLYLNGHGNTNSFNDFSIDNSAKINGLSTNTQILLDSCLTAGGADITQSIAYKIAKDNGVVVFGATESITNAKPIIGKDEKGNVEVKAMNAQDNGSHIPSVKIDGRPVLGKFTEKVVGEGKAQGMGQGIGS